jgi:hypothetical protein
MSAQDIAAALAALRESRRQAEVVKSGLESAATIGPTPERSSSASPAGEAGMSAAFATFRNVISQAEMARGSTVPGGKKGARHRMFPDRRRLIVRSRPAAHHACNRLRARLAPCGAYGPDAVVVRKIA